MGWKVALSGVADPGFSGQKCLLTRSAGVGLPVYVLSWLWAGCGGAPGLICCLLVRSTCLTESQDFRGRDLKRSSPPVCDTARAHKPSCGVVKYKKCFSWGDVAWKGCMEKREKVCLKNETNLSSYLKTIQKQRNSLTHFFK